MFGSIIRLSLMVAVLFFAGSSGAAAGGNYLLLAGPTQLRFQKPAARLDPALVLPPLRMDDEPVATNRAAAVFSPQLEEIQGRSASLGGESDAPTATAVITGSEDAPQSQQQTTTAGTIELSPQLIFQKYFQHSEKKSVYVPAHWEFVPPSPPVRAGSSATYSSPRLSSSRDE